jgi:hypothetical protein
MPLAQHERELIHDYCTKDLPGDLQWHVDQFSFVSNSELRKRLGRAFYSARYIYKLMEALLASGDEVHPFVKFQIIQYASIYEAVINNLLWDHYKEHAEVKKLETHKAYKPVSALGSLTSMTYEDEQLFTCVRRDEKTLKNSIAFKDKVDCAVRIGFLESAYSEEIKFIYKLRNLAHIEAEAEKQIEVEIEQSKIGYWRMRPFLEHVIETLAEEEPSIDPV